MTIQQMQDEVFGEENPYVKELKAEIERLKQWVSDCQSGMYVNCVYCGHRYGPGETTPVSMADALKAHVETCPHHPMSALKKENEWLRTVFDNGDEMCSQFIGALEIIRDHFTEDWQLKGDGKWRIRSIADALKQMVEAEKECVRRDDAASAKRDAVKELINGTEP